MQVYANISFNGGPPRDIKQNLFLMAKNPGVDYEYHIVREHFGFMVGNKKHTYYTHFIM